MKVGTDFSGIGAPEMALKYLGIDFESVFACEIDKYARQSYKQLHNPKTFYKDITTRNHKEVEQLDLYVAGFPCQAFSMAGRRLGFEDTRGTLFYNVAEFIKINKPKVFVLENVKGLVSHDSGKTFQTIIDILSNNGGTQNGQIILDMFDDGLGYHIYWQVLNTKNYGIPQNRDRIFIVGFKDFRQFSFPMSIELKLKLKDLLQDNTNDKYHLSYKMCKSIFESSKGDWQSGKMTIDTDIAKTINARVFKMAKADTDNYITVKDKYYLSDKAVDKIQRHNNKSIDNDISNCIHAGYYKIGGRDAQYIKAENKTKIIRLPNLNLKVTKRANDTPKEINEYLKDNKKVTIKEISNYLNLPKTKVEHYFRTDEYRAIPSPDVWIKLKKILKFDDSYDKQVTEINESIGTYESNSRLYDTNGISPTLQTNEQGFYKTENKIRRLTPLECWRLQGFRDVDFFSVKGLSDTQLYKQAGNSMTVNVLMALLKKIL